ncbi:MAG: 1-acyl-sn-glycerol-3-phosphate acyltransferase [Clostridia bacterium]|nr:1-acyl-sn-glycerol-3-phosphate acyltransferase [Clostridia bacterium]
MLIRPFIRIRYVGTENIPKKGSVILCSNHVSYFDPVALSMGMKRKIYYMAKSEFFTDYGFAVKWFFRICGVFPVKRNSCDRNAVHSAEEILNNNCIVGIFPQGGISNSRKSFTPKAGAALLAVKTATQVIPASIYFEGKIRPFAQITVRFGQTMIPPEDRSVKSARMFSKKIKEVILRQLEAEHQ